MLKSVKIVFSIAGNFWPHTAVAIKSIIQNDSNLEFVVFYDKDNKKWREKISKQVKKTSNQIQFFKFEKKLVEDIKDTGKLGKSVYYRLFIPELLDDCDRIIHFDSDIIVKKSIRDLIEFDLKGKVLAATPVFGFPIQKEVSAKLGFPFERPYFNAGIMVIDIPRWKNEQIAKRTIEFIQSNPEKLSYAEQCALNHVIGGNFEHLSPKWNLFRTPWEIKSGNPILHISFDELEDARKNPCLIHFVGPSKPWHFANNNPWKKDYCSIRQRFHFFPYISDDLISGILALIRKKIEILLK